MSTKAAEISKAKSDARKRAMLLALQHFPTAAAAAAAIGISAHTHVAWQRDDPAYAEQARIAETKYLAKLEAELHRRAVEGIDEPVFYRGEKVATIRKYSDRLLELALKRHDPAYRDSSTLNVEQQVAIAGTVNVQVVLDELENRDGFQDFARLVAASGDAGLFRSNGKQRRMATGPAPNGNGRNGNGHHSGQDNGADSDH